MIVGQDKKPPLEEAVMHFGTKGMKWGVRKAQKLPANHPSNSPVALRKQKFILPDNWEKDLDRMIKNETPAQRAAATRKRNAYKKREEANTAAIRAVMSEERRKRTIRAGAVRTAIILSLVGARVLINATTGQDVNLQDRYIDA